MWKGGGTNLDAEIHIINKHNLSVFVAPARVGDDVVVCPSTLLASLEHNRDSAAPWLACQTKQLRCCVDMRCGRGLCEGGICIHLSRPNVFLSSSAQDHCKSSFKAVCCICEGYHERMKSWKVNLKQGEAKKQDAAKIVNISYVIAIVVSLAASLSRFKLGHLV
jgi:hypothetical protein